MLQVLAASQLQNALHSIAPREVAGAHRSQLVDQLILTVVSTETGKTGYKKDAKHGKCFTCCWTRLDSAVTACCNLLAHPHLVLT